jgi:hypothetical protein
MLRIPLYRDAPSPNEPIEKGERPLGRYHPEYGN